MFTGQFTGHVRASDMASLIPRFAAQGQGEEWCGKATGAAIALN
jgi:hypothetical protein